MKNLDPPLADRLSLYLGIAQPLAEGGRDAVTSRELREWVGVNARRVREDLKAAGSRALTEFYGDPEREPFLITDHPERS